MFFTQHGGRRAAVGLIAALALLLTACGGSRGTATSLPTAPARTSQIQPGAPGAPGAGVSASQAGNGQTAGSSCPTEATNGAKTNTLLYGGVAAGAAYFGLIKPFRNGDFKDKQTGKVRKFKVAKAGLALLVAYKSGQKALEHAQDSPALCRVKDKFSNMLSGLQNIGSKMKFGQLPDAATVSQEATLVSAVNSGGVPELWGKQAAQADPSAGKAESDEDNTNS
ncbi:MAG TPA: hypothetical protein VI322_04585 [Candidatus Saccharimonadia bacterium]